MKRKLIPLFLIAASAFSVAAKDFYLTGSFNDWKPNLEANKFNEENGVYTLFMESLTGDFKITTPNWEEQFGCESVIEYGLTFSCIQSGDGYNMVLPDDPAKNITITFDYENKTVRFDKGETFYLVGDFNDWLLLPAYSFSADNGLFTLRTKSFSGNFRIVNDNYRYSFGVGSEVMLDQEQLISHDADDMAFNGYASEKNRIKITLNPNSTLVDEPQDDDSDNEEEEEEEGDTSAIDALHSDKAPIEYFNLQGVRVLNPSHGVFIRRQGNKTEKISVR